MAFIKTMKDNVYPIIFFSKGSSLSVFSLNPCPSRIFQNLIVNAIPRSESSLSSAFFYAVESMSLLYKCNQKRRQIRKNGYFNYRTYILIFLVESSPTWMFANR